MRVHGYDFLPFDEARIEATRVAWAEDAANGLAFPNDIERLFDWVAAHKDLVEHDSMAYGIFEVGTSIATGIAEIVIHRKTKGSKWVKMLRLHLRPSVDNDLQTGDVEVAMRVFTASMLGSFRLKMTHEATTLKIYGRTGNQLAFLKSLVVQLKKNKDRKFNASIDGRFLSIEVA